MPSRSKIRVSQERRSQVRTIGRAAQENINSLKDLDVNIGEHERDEGMPQTHPKWRRERDKEAVLDGYTCAWRAVIQTNQVLMAGAIVEHLRKGQEDAKNFAVRGTFRLSDETNRRVARELFNEARDDARAQLRAEGASLGFDAEKCRILFYGDPNEERHANRAFAASMALEAGGGSQQSEPLELYPGTQRVTNTTAFAFGIDESVYFIKKS